MTIIGNKFVILYGMKYIFVRKCIIHLQWTRVLILIYKMRNSHRCVLSGAILTKTNHSLFEVKCFFHRQLTSGVCVSFFYNCQLRDLCVLNSSPFIFNIVNADVFFSHILASSSDSFTRFICLCSCFRFVLPFSYVPV